MAIKLVNAGSIKPGSYIIIDGVACKASDISTSKPGKHGSAKARIVAMSLIGNKRKELVTGTGDNVEVPIIEKKTAQILSITGDKANVMDMESYETFDMEIPEDLKGQVAEGVQVLYWIILEDKVMKQIKG
ncbi:translation initiation factor IF-5A [Candidatus Woesearchaeota archaeon CG10_big_fil_rev_8_21_14_0_10_30_7]|nr:MAG: translation initiation factor IF-5A [Candidatus Woesearchaeota archaeon CG10_big_fil_rev_8_21_14_0_10_30_7]